MQENICSNKFGVVKFGTRAQGVKKTLHVRDTAAPPICSTTMGGNNRQNKLQEKITRLKRLISIKIAKPYRTKSNEALCINTGVTTIHNKINENAEHKKYVRGNRLNNLQIDHDKPPKQCLDPAARTIAIGLDNTQEVVTPINIYTDGSKSEQGVVAGIAIMTPGTPTGKVIYRMYTRCTNNQAEAMQF